MQKYLRGTSLIIIVAKGRCDNQIRKVMIITILRTEEKALSRKEIIESVRDSLENLQLEYIDLLVSVIDIAFANTNTCSITTSLLKLKMTYSQR